MARTEATTIHSSQREDFMTRPPTVGVPPRARRAQHQLFPVRRQLKPERSTGEQGRSPPRRLPLGLEQPDVLDGPARLGRERGVVYAADVPVPVDEEHVLGVEELV